LTPLWLAIFVSIFAFLASATKAKAADSMPNFTLAKKVVENIAPVISEAKVDENSASLVFAPEGYLIKPLVAETQITKEPPKKILRPVTLNKPVFNAKRSIESVPASHFPYGYCTYYASQRRFVPWSGNAISWLTGARSFGFATGGTPQAGAIIVTSEGGKIGHVGIVDAVDGDQVTISEMNYRGWGVVSSRTISATYSRIMGYIY